MNRILVLLIALSVVMNFVNYIFFYNDINPFYSIGSLGAFVGGALGITLPVVGVAAIIAVFFIISKKHKHSYSYYFAILFLILSLFSVVISVSTAPTPTPTSTPTPAPIPEPPKIEDGWVRLRIEDVGSIDYPSDFLELQSGDYRDMAKETYQVFRLGKSDFTLQQVGLNELKPSALDEYRRVIFRTAYLNPGEEVFRANEEYTLSKRELEELKDGFIDQILKDFEKLKSIGLGNNKIIDSGSIEIMEVNGMFPVVYTYKRQLNDNPVVLVQTYMFQNYDRIHHLAFSYRVVDEEERRDIYDKILGSFRLQ